MWQQLGKIQSHPDATHAHIKNTRRILEILWKMDMDRKKYFPQSAIEQNLNIGK